MDHWKGKVAVVTGASSGIGVAITAALVKTGVVVVGLARRMDRLENLAAKLSGTGGKIFVKQCDVAKAEDLLNALKWVKSELGGIDILVNNAGVGANCKVIEDHVSSFRKILDINVLATAIGIREAVASMKSRDVPGYVININSIFGHSIPSVDLGSSLYTASKYAITALTETVRKELATDPENKIKITSISPGYVKTGIVQTSGYTGLTNYFDKLPFIEPEDISDAVIYLLGTRPKVHVCDGVHHSSTWLQYVTVGASGQTIL